MISGDKASSAMISPSTIKSRIGIFDSSTALRTLVQMRMVDAAEAGKRKQGDPRREIEATRHVRGAQRDFPRSSAVGSMFTLVSAKKKTSPLRVITA